MAELRFNDVSSFGTANPITWVSAPPLPTIAAPDFSKITVEPGTTKAEIIYVTAYTVGASTATVTRNAEATQGGQNSAAAHTSVTWTETGHAFALGCANPSWGPTCGSGFAPAYAIFYDRAGGSDAANVVIGWMDLGGAQPGDGGPWALQIPAGGLWADTGS